MYPVKKLRGWITTSPNRFFFTAFFLFGAIIFYLDRCSCHDSKQWGELWSNVLVEAHGLLFDLIVFGILLSIYDTLRAKNDRITRNEEEIEDFRGWDEKEAMYRIVGAIKRLNKEGISKMVLDSCNLNGAYLQDRSFDGSDMVMVKLQNADLRRAKLRKVILLKAQLNYSDLEGADLEEASLVSADLSGAKLGGANLTKADLRGARFEGSSFIVSDGQINFARISKLAILDEAIVSKQDWIENLKKWKVAGANEVSKIYYVDTTPITEPLLRQSQYYLIRRKDSSM